MVHVIYDLVCISIRICDKNTETLQRFRRLHRERLFNFLFSRSKKKFNYTQAFLRKSIIRLGLDGFFQNEFYFNM